MAFALAWIFAAAPAWGFRPAILFDLADPARNAFTLGAREGAASFGRIAGAEVAEFAPVPGAPSDPASLVERALAAGHDPILGVGFMFAEAIATKAPAHPDTRFILVDALVDRPNVRAVVFRDEQGSFLMGALAAMASRKGMVGFVGGMEGDLIRNFGCGFAQGARRVRPGVTVLAAMAGTGPEAFDDPARGAALTRAMAARGADVVYHAAGRTGDGVIDAAAEAGILAIGVDVNQNGRAPGRVLSSMIKRMDVAVHLALREAMGPEWRGGVTRLGIKEGGIDWALDEHNTRLIGEERQIELEDVTIDILSGRVEVVAYARATGCPVAGMDPPP